MSEYANNNETHEISLISCTCGHGGGIWHYNTYEKCSYPKCNCNMLKVDFAIVDHKRVSSFEFKKLTKRPRKSQEFNLGEKSHRCFTHQHKVCDGQRLVKCECNCHD